MKVILKPGLIILAPEDTADHDALQALDAASGDHVFHLAPGGRGAALHDLGPRDAALRTPINITSRAPGALRLISNFAATPFELDGRPYASVEGFWQGLKFEAEADRRRLAALDGVAAKDAGAAAPSSDLIRYDDALIQVGTADHWALVARACAAKFEQHAPARRALLATGDRPLTHKVRPDSRTIPGVILADIWMRLRDRLR